jgi:hexosaminidase
MQFSARIEGIEIHCEIGTDRPLKAPVLCLSLMAAVQVVSGGTLVKTVAGYAEVLLPDLAVGHLLRLVLVPGDPQFRPRNRAWLPMSPYLRADGGCIALPAGSLLGAKSPSPEQPEVLPAGALALVPPPQSWEPTGGIAAVQAVACMDGRLDGVASLAVRLGFAPLVGAQGVPLKLEDDTSLSDEGYRLTVAAAGITIASATAHGLHNAAVTLLNLRETTGGQIPCGAISDMPRFGYRGQHLDCARHFYSVSTILHLLDVMALLKLNRFHWHFADDEAFRLEVECAPELWQKTAFRGEDELVPGVFGGGMRSGGSYSKADVAQVLARADELHIEVLPEIEVPAHCYGMLKAVPGLRDPDDTGREESIQGYPENIINPAVPESFEFLHVLMDEITRWFPLRILHLGGDELPPGAWEGSPAVAALRVREGLVTAADVQGWMMERLAARLRANGVRAAAWEEAARGNRGGIGNNALLFSWTGQGPGIEAARRGHDVVMCPAQHVYLDHAHSSDPDDWGAAWAGFTPLEKTVEWDPVPEDCGDIASRIAGVQGCFWSEFTTDDGQLDAMILPRLLGVACKAWEQDGTTSGARLRGFARAYAPILERIQTTIPS